MKTHSCLTNIALFVLHLVHNNFGCTELGGPPAILSWDHSCDCSLLAALLGLDGHRWPCVLGVGGAMCLQQSRPGFYVVRQHSKKAI